MLPQYTTFQAFQRTKPNSSAILQSALVTPLLSVLSVLFVLLLLLLVYIIGPNVGLLKQLTSPSLFACLFAFPIAQRTVQIIEKSIQISVIYDVR